MRILIVNIEGNESAALRQLLESGGNEVMATWSGVEALEMAASSRFDLMLISHYVPDLYVGDLLDRVADLPNAPAYFVLASAGKTTGDEMVLTTGTEIHFV